MLISDSDSHSLCADGVKQDVSLAHAEQQWNEQQSRAIPSESGSSDGSSYVAASLLDSVLLQPVDASASVAKESKEPNAAKEARK